MEGEYQGCASEEDIGILALALSLLPSPAVLSGCHEAQVSWSHATVLMPLRPRAHSTFATHFATAV